MKFHPGGQFENRLSISLPMFHPVYSPFEDDCINSELRDLSRAYLHLHIRDLGRTDFAKLTSSSTLPQRCLHKDKQDFWRRIIRCHRIKEHFLLKNQGWLKRNLSQELDSRASAHILQWRLTSTLQHARDFQILYLAGQFCYRRTVYPCKFSALVLVLVFLPC